MTDVIDAVKTGLADVQTKLNSAMDAHTAEIAKFGKASTKLTGDVDALSEQYKEMKDQLIDLAQKMSPAAGEDAAAQTAGQEFVKSDAFKALVDGKTERARVEVKNTIVTGTNMPFAQQNAGIIPGSFIPRTIRGQIPTVSVNSNSVTSLKENAWTNAAVEVAEAAAKPESSLTFTPYNVIIENVAHWLKISRQLLMDAPAVVSYIDTRLRDGIAQRIESQLLLGNGTTPNLSGLTDSGNFTAFTPTTGANLAESINKAKYARWAVGEIVDTVIVNPTNWAALELLKDTGGAYLFGTPGTNAAMTQFGITVILSPYMTAGSFLIGNLRNSAIIYQREGTVVEMGYVGSDFTSNLITIRAEERLGLGVERPAGIMFGAITA